MLASTTTRHLKTFFDELDESSKLVFPSLFLPLEARVVIGFRRAAEEGAICLRETFFFAATTTTTFIHYYYRTTQECMSGFFAPNHPPWAIIEGELLNTVVDWELRVVKNLIVFPTRKIRQISGTDFLFFLFGKKSLKK